MSTDLLHALVSGLLIGSLILLLQNTAFIQGKSKLQRFGVFFVVGFVAILILNLVWPVGP